MRQGAIAATVHCNEPIWFDRFIAMNRFGSIGSLQPETTYTMRWAPAWYSFVLLHSSLPDLPFYLYSAMNARDKLNISITNSENDFFCKCPQQQTIDEPKKSSSRMESIAGIKRSPDPCKISSSLTLQTSHRLALPRTGSANTARRQAISLGLGQIRFRFPNKINFDT